MPIRATQVLRRALVLYPAHPQTLDIYNERMSSARGAKNILTDSHFLIPFAAFLIGLALLIAMH
jgi:hypothetical protein